LFSKILVPLDGSEHSLKALDEAAQIAKKFSGKLTLIHVYSVQPIIMPEASTSSSLSLPIITGAEVSMMIDTAKKLGNKILENGEKRIKTSGVPVEKMLVEGHPVEEIVRVANQDKFDLIVIGARGVSHMIEMLLGSVTDGVMHHVHCPVLVMK
jgi:nucleotide-binding universal stress UspA family protein